MRIVLSVILTLLFLGCQEVKRPEQPENLIPKEKMVEILTDAYIGNAAKSINNRMLKTKGIYLDSVLYKKFGIDSVQFVQSNAFYTSDLNLYAELLSSVEERLELRKAIADSLYDIEKKALEKKRDSLKGKDSTKVKKAKKDSEGILTDPVQDEEE